MQRNVGCLTCVADFLKAEQAEDAVIELHLLTMALVHLIEDLHQLVACLGWMSTRSFMHCQLMERAVPRAANTLVLALRHPSRIKNSGQVCGLNKWSCPVVFSETLSAQLQTVPYRIH